MNRIIVPQHLRTRQELASDPGRSVWVSANAGSGKTHVLTQRVIRLLLAGVPPARILCLTFTKAAAAQMATRVFETLSRWTRLDDADLHDAILQTGVLTPTSVDLLLARRLFTRTIETPGGLKIQTIHAFCERLLHLFPFEANVPARFEVADELRAQELLARAKRAAIEAAQGSTGEQRDKLQVVSDTVGQTGIDALIADVIRLRASARHFPRDLQDALAERLGADPSRTAADLRRSMVEDGLHPNRWTDIAAAFKTGSLRDNQQGARLREAMAAYARENLSGAFVETLVAYLSVFFDSTDQPRSALMTKGLRLRFATLDADLMSEIERLCRLREDLKAATAIERTQALLSLASSTIDIYDREKTAAAILDFDDLIERTLSLLDRSNVGWVLHKLDSGIDHILVDEAQDTSAAQWKILERLTDDFASGHGRPSRERSFFVVGDEKQSIFSFQGAAPEMFDAMRSAFERRFKDGQKAFERVELKTSFRSVPIVLDAVDKVFEPAGHQDGLVSAPDPWPLHESIKSTLPGLIEIWPNVGATNSLDEREWSIPVDTPSERDPANIVADRVAKKIKALTSIYDGDWTQDGDRRRRLKAGDVLILVRTRNAFFEAVIRALKRHHVPVAGADRLDVANHIAVMDLVAAGRTALLPQDDLSLATLLKSPLFGLTDEDLMDLAPTRTGSLIDALASSAQPRHQRPYKIIQDWIERAAGATPFAFYVELLGRDGGRRLIETRLGPEAHDAIDEFLRLALAHEQQGAPSLVTFLDDVEALEGSIRRDMEDAGDMVRVMTVHAAKGLEAKVVFLPDTCQVPSTRFDPTIFDLNKSNESAPILVWSPRKADDPQLVALARAAERQATMREYRRLLYVALTRAEERLYIAGFYNIQAPPSDCWSAMINATLEGGVEVAAFWGEGDSIRQISTASDQLSAVDVVDVQHPLRLVPEWLGRPVTERPNARRITPSQRVRGTAAEQRNALAYGSAIHQLLQYLPKVQPVERIARAKAFLDARVVLSSSADRDTAAAEATAVLAMPQLERIFAANSRGEVPVVGRLPQPNGETIVVNGIVDRLAVTDDEVIVVDFKTGKPNPQAERAYKTQLALYGSVLSDLWPSKRMALWLVWTKDRRVVDVSGAASP